MSCGLCTVGFAGRDHAALQKRLREHHGILVQAFSASGIGGRAPSGVDGIRVTPNVYTTPAELDRFLSATASF